MQFLELHFTAGFDEPVSHSANFDILFILADILFILVHLRQRPTSHAIASVDDGYARLQVATWYKEKVQNLTFDTVAFTSVREFVRIRL